MKEISLVVKGMEKVYLNSIIIGNYYYENGDRYEGSYRNGIQEGHGIYYYDTGDKYDGTWVNGKRQGKGKLLS